MSRQAESDLAEVLYRQSMSLLAYSPLAGGVLSGKYLGGARPPDSRFVRFDNFALRFRKPLVAEAAEKYAEVARAHGLTLTELALGYVRSRWYLGSSIIGATSLAQLDEDIKAAQVTLDAATLAAIAEVALRYPNPAG